MHLDVIIPHFIASILLSADCLGFENEKKALGACILASDYEQAWDLSGLSPIDLISLRYFIAQELARASTRVDSVTVFA